VCQLHTAMAVLVRSWWDNNRSASERLLQKTAKKITTIQRRKAQARKSHTKKTRRKLKKLGIRLSDLPKCNWGRT
jgi:alcohol dehydrogenase YqhD (iron-dependent ADH family)